jgi:hypothetical protein
LRHGFSFGLGKHVRRSRGEYRETPARSLTLSSPEQAQRIAALQSRYQVQFEAQLCRATSLDNCEQLAISDRFCMGSACHRGGMVQCSIHASSGDRRCGRQRTAGTEYSPR